MPYQVTAYLHKGRKDKPGYSLRVVVPKPILLELVPEIFDKNKPAPVFDCNWARKIDDELERYYEKYDYDFGLERYMGTIEDYKHDSLYCSGFSVKDLTRYGKSFGFTISSRSTELLEMIGLKAGAKLTCDIVEIEDPRKHFDKKAILYKVIS